MQSTTNALISVIVPVYRVEMELNACVDSILNQTYENLEIILVDDGSPDDCGAICDRYETLDARVRTIHKANGGLSDARNAGLDICKGEYVAFVDSDDIIHPRYLEFLYAYSQGVDIVVCDFQTFYVENEIKEENIQDVKSEDVLVSDLLKNLWHLKYPQSVVAWNKLYKRSVWNDIRYPYGKIHEDEFVIHRILYGKDKIRFIDSKLYYYRQRANSIMSNSSKDATATMHKMEALYDRKLFFKDNGLNEGIKEINSEILYRCLMRTIDNNNAIWKSMTIKEILFTNSLPLRAKILLGVKKINYNLYSKIVKLVQN